MRRNKTIAFLLSALMCLSMLTACAGKPVAATVGDREVTVQELETAYANNVAYAAYYGTTPTTAAEAEALQDSILNSLIDQQLKAYKAEQAGVTLTDEEKATAQKNADESYQSTIQSFIDNAQSAGAADPAAYANQMLTDTLIANGSSVGKLKKQLLQDATDTLLIEKHKTELIAAAQMDEAALKDKYETELASQKALFAEDQSKYFEYELSAQYGATFMPLFVPEGLFYVKHILVKTQEEAQNVLDLINAGGDFEELMLQYNTDTALHTEQYAAGYAVGEGAGFVEPFLNAALALEKEGDLSEIVESDYGFHIIKRYADIPAGDVAYADVKETFDTFAQTLADNEAYNAVVEAWEAEDGLITRYEENYRFIGKENLPEATAAPAETTAEGNAQ